MMNMQIRIATDDLPASVTIYFTHLNLKLGPFDINAYDTYTYSLDNPQKAAVYNYLTGITTDYSIYISSTEPVSVYAFTGFGGYVSATNVLPVTALGTEYYHCSYTHVAQFNFMDAYAVVATQDNTQVWHNGDPVAILNAGQVYYRASTDMTGSLITANNPVAFFALHQGAFIPADIESYSLLMQQLAPVITWDRTFFVPVTVMEEDIVRIVVSQNDTNIEQTGGVIRAGVSGAQATLDNLQAGDFVELDIGSNGCFIRADKPVGVCSYIKKNAVLGEHCTTPEQVWIPGIKQTVSHVVMSPFITTYVPQHVPHYALILTSTATKEHTKVSIGGGTFEDLEGGIWRDNEDAEMSFYSMPLTNVAASYHFFNQGGMIIWGCSLGYSPCVTYYYLAGSGMHDLDVAFYANDIHFQDLKDTIFCERMVAFRAEIEDHLLLHPDPGRLKWFIDEGEGEYEYMPARDQLIWNKTFPAGDHEITMLARFENDDEVSKTGTLKINPFCCGAGTKENPYLICTAAQLDSVRLYLDAHFKLANDIPLNDYLSLGGAGHTKWGASGWDPIGTATKPFTGSLNGDGYKITGLWINRTGDNYVGLFGYIDGATIENVGVILKME